MTTRLNKLGVNTHRYRRVTYLVIDEKLVCPCCLIAKTKWHIHHFIQVMDGGRDIKQNMVVICTICHRTIHEGEDDEAMFLWEVLRNYMWSKYGLVNNMNKTVVTTMLNESGLDSSKLSSFREIHKTIKIYCGNMYKEFMITKGIHHAD